MTPTPTQSTNKLNVKVTMIKVSDEEKKRRRQKILEVLLKNG